MKKNSTTLLRTTKEINRNFKIKVFGRDALGKKINTLVGVSGLIKLIGDINLVNTLIERAFKNSYFADKVVCKLRRGLQISFYCF